MVLNNPQHMRTMTMELVKSREVAAELGIAAETLCRWRKTGRGPAFIQEGTWVRYTRAAIDAFKTATVADVVAS
jgi:predicted site-specific integrase-resolvase